MRTEKLTRISPFAVELAQALRRFQTHNNLSGAELFARLFEAATEVDPDITDDDYDEDDFRHFLMCARPVPAKSARVYLPAPMIGAIYRMGLLEGFPAKDYKFEPVITCTPRQGVHREQAVAFQSLLEQNKQRAQVIVGYGESLPCSMEVPEYMHARHEALFSDITDDEERQAYVEYYDTIGTPSRAELERLGKERTWKLIHMMTLENFEALFNGKGLYRAIPRDLRLACLQDLIDKLEHPQDWKVYLVLADTSTRKLPSARYFIDDDTIACIGNSLCFSRDHAGTLSYSTDLATIRKQRKRFEDFQAHALYKTNGLVVPYLKNLSRTVQKHR